MSGKSELKLFDDHPPQVVVDSASFEDVHPSNSLDSKTTNIEFAIAGSNVDYLDLNDTLLSLRVKLVDADGNDFTTTEATKNPTPSNWFLNALINDVSLYFNDVLIEGGSTTYPYKATIESVMNFGDDAKRIQMLPAGFSSESKERQKWGLKSQIFELVGALRCDFFNQPKYLLPGVNVRLSLKLTSNKFALKDPSEANMTDSSFRIQSAMLYVRRVKVVPAVSRGIEYGLQSKNAIYPYTRSKVITFNIGTGETSCFKDNLFSSGLLPKLIVVGMVKGSAYTGNSKGEPFNFEHFNISRIELLRNGQPVPYRRAYECDFDKNIFSDAYVRSILLNMNLLNNDRNNGIDMSDFSKNGYCFFTFNLTPDFDIKERQCVRDCNLRLDLMFHKALKEPINVIAYATYDGVVQITKDRSIIKDVYS